MSLDIWCTILVVLCKWLHCDLWPFPQVSDPGLFGPYCFCILVLFLCILKFITVWEERNTVEFLELEFRFSYFCLILQLTENDMWNWFSYFVWYHKNRNTVYNSSISVFCLSNVKWEDGKYEGWSKITWTFAVKLTFSNVSPWVVYETKSANCFI